MSQSGDRKSDAAHGFCRFFFLHFYSHFFILPPILVCAPLRNFLETSYFNGTEQTRNIVEALVIEPYII